MYIILHVNLTGEDRKANKGCQHQRYVHFIMFFVNYFVNHFNVINAIALIIMLYSSSLTGVSPVMIVESCSLATHWCTRHPQQQKNKLDIKLYLNKLI